MPEELKKPCAATSKKKVYIYIWSKGQHTAVSIGIFRLTLASVPEIQFTAAFPDVQ
jgi:hypothetical protein